MRLRSKNYFSIQGVIYVANDIVIIFTLMAQDMFHTKKPS